MKSYYRLLLLLLLSLPLVLSAQNGYRIQVTVHGIENDTLFLAHHYGNKQYVIDTVATDATGTAVFTGTDSLKGGVYLIVLPKLGNKYFEFIAGEPSFTIEADTSDISQSLQATGSIENQVMFEDLRFINPKREKVNKLREDLAKEEPESKKAQKLQEDIEKINEEVLIWRNTLQEKHGDTFYAKLLRASQDIDLPEAPLNPDGTTDKTFLLRYIQQHYFDNIDFQDPRLMRTNILPGKVDYYLNNYVLKQPDTINAALDFMIEKMRGNNEVFQYFVVTLLNQYATSEIMGMDAVFVHMVDKYYKSGEAFWLDDAAMFRITQKAERIRPTLIGRKAAPIMLQDTAGLDIPLYSLAKDFTVILFWDVDCSHCKKELPVIEAAYPAWKELGVEVYAVYTQEEWDKWKKWLLEHHYPWINVGDVQLKSNYQLMYNVEQTPIIYILDKDKRIIAKKLKAENVEKFIEQYIEINGK